MEVKRRLQQRVLVRTQPQNQLLFGLLELRGLAGGVLALIFLEQQATEFQDGDGGGNGRRGTVRER